ncbi:MAG: hypothetical protein R2762_30840 [Bryobacteraceae bacterium]
MTLIILAVAFAAAGQEPQRKLVEVRHKTPGEICTLLSILAPSHSVLCGSNQLNTIGLKGTQETIAMLEEMIRKLDQPPPAKRNIEITAFMILGTEEKGSDLPQSLAGVAAQLRQIFSFSGYKLIETMLIRGSEGDGGETSGIMPVAGEPAAKPMYQFRYQQCTITGDGAERRFHLKDVRFGGRVPIPNDKGFTYIDTGVNTTIDVREGQKAVIGKASLGPGRESLFLVLSARVVD